MVSVRHLVAADAEAYVELRRASLHQAPLAFSASPEDDLVATVESVREQLARAPESVIVGAFAPWLVGAAALFRDRHLKAAHKAHLVGMFVDSAFRRRGIGARLLAAALDHARRMEGVDWVHLTVSSAAPGARALYEKAGFELWGSEADALRYRGRSVTDFHLALRL